MLNGSGIVAVVGELVAAGMAQHVGMDRKRHICDLAESGHEVMEAHWADRPATLADEHIGFCRVFTAEPAQGTDLVATDGMDAWRSTLGSAHVQPALVELDLMPL